MFSFINSAMSSATQRYLTFSLGKGDKDRLSKVFSTSMNIHGLVSLLIVILAETVGLWFVNTHMTIPADRMLAANVVYQMSILATVVMIMSTPFNALIVAHERMSAFAYISILEVSLKLGIVFLLKILGHDKLIFYAILVFLVQLLIRIIYSAYCHRHFEESKYKRVKEKELFKEMMNFSGWSLFGNLASVAANQGVNIVLNMFFGPAVNAARGVAVQVQNAIQGFSTNFQAAMNPQITKNYAIGNLTRMHRLVFASSKFSFFLLFILSLPILLETNFILSIWLVEVPEHSVNFLRIILLTIMVNTIAGPLTISAQANGNIKIYQAVVGGIMLLTLPLSYVGLKLFAVPELVFIIDFAIICIAQVVRLAMVRKMIKMSLREYFKYVAIPIVAVAFLSSAIPVGLYLVLPDSVSSFFIVTLASVISVASFVYLIGLSKSEKEMVLTKVRQILSKKKDR